MTRTADYDTRQAQREFDNAADAYEIVRSNYTSGIVRDESLLHAAHLRMVSAEAALIAAARCY